MLPRKKQWADGAYLFISVWYSDYRSSLFYRLWSMGASGYGSVQIYKAMLAGVYNSGQLSRDFIYIDDIVEGVLRIADVIPIVNHD